MKELMLSVTCRQFAGVLPVLALTSALLSGCFSPRPLARNHRPSIGLDCVPIQYLSGRRHATFTIHEAQWAALRGYFDPPAASPREERHAIRYAIAMMEQIAGEQTPTGFNLGRNRHNPLGAGNTDCIDESANTRNYLILLDQHGLLHWHELMTTAHRGPLQFDIHNSAAIRDRTTQAVYVVDSWHLNNGSRPYVQLYDDWMRKRPLPDETP